VKEVSARNETPHLIIQKLGKKKSNGSWDASTEDITIAQIIEVADVQKERLTGKNLQNRCREVIGTCVAMRIKVEGLHPKEALQQISEGAFDAQLS
jgi:large subunit ribosomal protein L11